MDYIYVMNIKLLFAAMFLNTFLLFSSAGFAQDIETRETQFNRFVKRPDIEWAMFRYDSISLDNSDFNQLLINRMKKKEIKTAEWMWGGSKEEQKIIYRTVERNKEISSAIELVLPVYDTSGNISLSDLSTRSEERTPINILNVYEIFFIKSGRLNAYTTYTAPVFLIITGSNDTLGRAEFFVTAINKNPFFKSAAKDRVTYLGQTRRAVLVDSVPPADRLKELYGRNLIKALWPTILSPKTEKILMSTGKKITAKELQGGEWTGNAVSVPQYDSVGNISDTRKIYPEINAAVFKKAEITQTWFYNRTKNIVFSKIPDIILFTNISDKNGVATLTPAVKIVF